MAAVKPQFDIPPIRDSASVAISTGATGLSDAIDLGGWSLATISPSTGWTAAGLTAQVSLDGSTFSDFYDESGAEYTIGMSANRTVKVPVADFYGVKTIKFRSGTASVPVAQTTSRTLTLGLIK